MTPKQRAFAHEYVKNGGFADPAAVKAGYTKQYAKSKSYRLVEIPDVAAEIKRMRARMNERADKSATDVVNGLSRIAFSDRVDFLKEDPDREGEFIYKAPDELTDDQRHCVESVKMYTAEIVVLDADGKAQSIYRQEYRYVFADKAKALENMGRHFGIFDDKLRLGVAQSNPFKDATPAQLAQLKKSWVQTMTDPKLLEGEFKVVKDG